MTTLLHQHFPIRAQVHVAHGRALWHTHSPRATEPSLSSRLSTCHKRLDGLAPKWATGREQVANTIRFIVDQEDVASVLLTHISYIMPLPLHVERAALAHIRIASACIDKQRDSLCSEAHAHSHEQSKPLISPLIGYCVSIGVVIVVVLRVETTDEVGDLDANLPS